MNFLRSFESGAQKQVKSHFTNLMTVAMADGKLAEAEYNYLLRLGEKFFMSEEDVKNVMENAKHYSFVAPSQKAERTEQLKDLVAMLLIDGKILAEEINMCKKFALALHYKPEVVVKIVNCLISYSNKEFDKYDVLADIEDIVD
ncbi:hypothetical protein ACFLRI_00120 [Bacteroidota bacterium]